jgi:Protease inhibitor Inh
MRHGVTIGFVAGMCILSGVRGAAFAEDAPPLSDAASAMIGTWEFSNADHDKTCRFIFRADQAPNGYKLDIDKNCPTVFPATRDLAAWMVDNYGGLQLLDSAGKAAIELTEAEAGIYDGFEPTQGRYVLQSAAAAPVRSAEDMIGDWAIARGTGKPICTLTLARTPAGADSMAIKIKPGCEAGVTRFAPTSWRMDQGELIMLSARGQNWRFEENDANTWQRVPEEADPVLLVRQ